MRAFKLLAPVVLAGLVVGCTGGTDPVATTVNVSGAVSALNGQVAFYSPSTSDKLMAALFGKPLFAAITGESSVGPGVTVNLIEVDNAGAQVGEVIASATTDTDGKYSIDAPEGFVASSAHVVRAVNSTGAVTIEARVDSLTPNIDTTTDVTSSVIAANALDLTKLSPAEIAEIQAALEDVVENTDATTATVDAYRAAILTAAADNEAATNVVSSSVASGQICGTVKDSAGTALGNIRIVVRDFGNWVTRAKTKTAADGTYCVNVPKAGDADPYIAGKVLEGEYILGALNFTSTSYAASQWWTSTSDTAAGTGGANSQFKAEKIEVLASSTTITKDMVLDKDGARVTGTVTGTGGASVEGMRVVIRNYDTFKPLASAKVKADNTYRINVKTDADTDYMISFRNKTRHPYASEIYRAVNGTDTGGAFNRNMASRETMVANQDNTYDAELAAGAVISGIVKDNDGIPVSGEVIYVNNADGGRIEALRTNKSGKFRIWVNSRLGTDFSAYTKPAAYTVNTRGQALAADTNGANDNTITHFKLSANPSTGLVFDAQTTKVTATLMSADATPAPVSSAVVFLADSNGLGSDLSVSAADGSVVLYTENSGITQNLRVRMDNDVNYGSGSYDGTSAIIKTPKVSNPFSASSDVNLNTLTMPTLGDGSGGVGYVKGNAGAGSTKVKFFVPTISPTTFMVATNSRGDGSFNVTVPAGTYAVRSDVGTGVCSISVTNASTTTLTYVGGTTNTCTVSP